MGMAGAIVGGLVAGLGMSMLNRQKSPDYSSMLSTNAQALASAPTTPAAPSTPTEDGEKKSEAMRLAEEEEKKKRAADAEANKTNFTGGLGVTTPASVQRKTLLG